MLPLESLTSITQQFQLARLLSQTIHAKGSHDLIHGLPRRLVIVEEITGEEDHVNLHPSASTLADVLPAIKRTSWSLARHMISWNVFQLSSPRMWSRSLYPTWLSVAMRTRIESAAAARQNKHILWHTPSRDAFRSSGADRPIPERPCIVTSPTPTSTARSGYLRLSFSPALTPNM